MNSLESNINKQCLRTDSRLQRLTMKEVHFLASTVALPQMKESKHPGNQKPNLFFFPEEVILKSWETFVLASDFFFSYLRAYTKKPIIFEGQTPPSEVAEKYMRLLSCHSVKRDSFLAFWKRGADKELWCGILFCGTESDILKCEVMVCMLMGTWMRKPFILQ